MIQRKDRNYIKRLIAEVGGKTKLEQLDDVTLNSKSKGDILTFGGQKWKNTKLVTEITDFTFNADYVTNHYVRMFKMGNLLFINGVYRYDAVPTENVELITLPADLKAVNSIHVYAQPLDNKDADATQIMIDNDSNVISNIIPYPTIPSGKTVEWYNLDLIVLLK